MENITSRREADEFIYLPSIIYYKDSESVAKALLDDDFCNKTLTIIARVVLETDEKMKEEHLKILQHRCKGEDLEKVALAMDDKGYMYDTCPYMKKIIMPRLYENCKERYHLCAKPVQKQPKRQIVKKTVPQRIVPHRISQPQRWYRPFRQR